ncbi:MAG: pirin family protein [Anaerolineales bacterium]
MTEEPRAAIHVIDPQMVIEGAGVLLQRSFGPSRENNFDPFLLFDHFAFNDPIEGPLVGFPMHPHRGIETVTYMLEGNTRHRDSLGNMGVIGPGDVQWMTSGRGIMHEEMPKRGPDGTVNGFQLWVNLPAAEKMGRPRYQEVSSETIPTAGENGAEVRVVAGQFDGVSGPVTEIAAQPLYMDVTLKAGEEFSLPVPTDHTVVAYVFEGRGLFGKGVDETVGAVRMVVFGEGGLILVRAAPNSHVRFMLMAGEPFGEPIVPYGPFVMNTETEIMQALTDLRNGTFVQN